MITSTDYEFKSLEKTERAIFGIATHWECQWEGWSKGSTVAWGVKGV